MHMTMPSPSKGPTCSSSPMCLGASFNYRRPEISDGYWTSDKFIEQIKYCVDIAECKYPKSEGYKVVWVFDHSSGLGAYSKDALNASQMNVKPGGKQPVICNTVWQGKEQRMVFNICIPKGLVYRC